MFTEELRQENYEKNSFADGNTLTYSARSKKQEKNTFYERNTNTLTRTSRSEKQEKNTFYERNTFADGNTFADEMTPFAEEYEYMSMMGVPPPIKPNPVPVQDSIPFLLLLSAVYILLKRRKAKRLVKSIEVR